MALRTFRPFALPSAVSRLALCLGLFAGLFSTPLLAAGPVSWKTTRLYKSDYVDVRDLAARFGHQVKWLTAGKKILLQPSGKGLALSFEEHERDCQLGDVRVFLGEPIVAYQDSLWIGADDAAQIIVPLLQPGLRNLPAPPKIIVIDPGHGGTDPGKQNHRLNLDEKDMTLDVAFRLRKILEGVGFKVVMTRTTDTRFSRSPAVDLKARADVVSRYNANLLISIHFNAVAPSDAPRVSGSETYTLPFVGMLSTASSTKDSMTDTKFPGNKHDDASNFLGYMIHRQLITELKTSDRGYKRARFSILRHADCPSVLVEAAYLSNDAEARRVATPAYRQRIAEAIARGVHNYSESLSRVAAKQEVW